MQCHAALREPKSKYLHCITMHLFSMHLSLVLQLASKMEMVFCCFLSSVWAFSDLLAGGGGAAHRTFSLIC